MPLENYAACQLKHEKKKIGTLCSEWTKPNEHTGMDPRTALAHSVNMIALGSIWVLFPTDSSILSDDFVGVSLCSRSYTSTTANLAIPSAARSTNVKIKIYQPSFTANRYSWGIDNIVILYSSTHGFYDGFSSYFTNCNWFMPSGTAGVSSLCTAVESGS